MRGNISCRKVAIVVAAVMAVLPTAAFGGQSASSAGIVAQAKAAVAKAASANGTYVLPVAGPTGNPAVKGKNVFVISCGLAAEACAKPAENVQLAAKTLGWKVTVYDGKFSATGYDAGIRQAIAAKADGIVLVAIDCSNAKGALGAARAAGVKVVAAYAYDCNDPLIGGPSLFDATINSNGNPDQWATANAKLRADYAIATTNGKAKVLSLDQPEFLVAKWWTNAFQARLALCSTCKLLDHVAFTGNDLVNNRAAQQLGTAILRHPDVNVLFVTSDALMQALLPAIRSAKAKNPKLLVIANEGFAATQQLIRQGVADVAVGIYTPWMGWSAADALNRVFNGQKSIPNQGLGYHLITKANVPAANTVWAPSLDYQAAFKKIWNSKG